MSKEYLEALKTIKNFLGYNYCSVDLPNELKCVEQTLQRLESIDNANPSEALECLKELEDIVSVYGDSSHIVEPIEQSLLKSQEQEKVLKILFEKEVNLGMLKTCKTVEQYNAGCRIFGRNKLTPEEFDLLKRWLR